MSKLEIKNLSAYYGKLRILNNICLKVEEGEIVAIVGSNGAGKSTLLCSILGLVKNVTGEIKFMGKRIDNLPVYKRAKAGINMTFERKGLFKTMTVEENLNMGAYVYYHDKEKRRETMEKIFELFPILKKRRNQIAEMLSGGEAEMLAIGRSLMANPKMLMLDEPSLGLAPKLLKPIFEIIQRIKQQGTTILLVEQDIKKSLSIADRGYVIVEGEIFLSGTGKELLNDKRIKKAYLGM